MTEQTAEGVITMFGHWLSYRAITTSLTGPRWEAVRLLALAIIIIDRALPSGAAERLATAAVVV